MKSRFISILIILLNITILSAQNIKFTATATKVVTVGEQFQLVYSINSQGNSFAGPDLKQFNRLGGPSTSSSSSMQVSNGKYTKTISNSYTYILSAKRVGKYTIRPAQIKVNGKTYRSNQVNIEVVKSKSRSNGNKNTSSGLKEDDLFVKTLLSKSNMYQGEHLIVTLKVYSRTRNLKFTNVKLPSFDSFLTSDIEKPNNLFRENYNGEVYFVGIFKKAVLFPQRSGEITIDPFELQCQVSVESGHRKDFFGRRVPAYKNLMINLKSHPRKVKVKALPKNNSSDYTGAVGSFNMKATLDKTSAKTNDAITLKVRISGRGNLKLIDPLTIKFPHDFEVYDPKILNNFNSSVEGVKGSKTFEYLIIPRHAGDFKIPAISFTYFDIKSGTYKTLSSNQFNLSIEKGNDDQSTTIVSGFSKEDIKFIGKDIRYIKTNTVRLSKKYDFIYGSLMFWITYVFALILFLSILFIRRKLLKENSNLALTKNKKANKEARKRLKSAAIFLKSNEENKFYLEILTAFYGYLGNKLNIPVSDMTKETALEKLSIYNIEDEDINKFIELLNNCEFAQYAPGEKSDEMQTIYKESERLIGVFENKIK